MTQSLPWGPEVVQFGDYVLNLRTGELLRDGARLLLPEQPFRILALLVRRRGELVTREDLRLQLWSEDTFVDFEHSLNAAIKRLREALGDSAAAPRYIETLPRRGYRFIAAIDERNATTAWREAASAAAASPVVGSTREQPEPSRPIVDSATANFESVTSQWSRVRRASAFGLASALVLGGIVWGVRHWQTESSWRRAGRLDPPVIAVLPLKNLSTESDSGYFVDGLTDEIIRNLAVIRGVQVRSRTSSFAFKDKPRNLREVGEQLGANLVVEGSVLRSGDRLRINASLVDVAGDVTLWSDRFDRQLNDVFAIQDEISRAIVNQLRLTLGRGQRRYDTNLDAYELYLKAQALVDRPGRAADSKAIELFDQVIAKDAAFAPAYAGLANRYASMSMSPYQQPSPTSTVYRISSDTALSSMRRAAVKALELDPLLAEAHAAMGLVHSRDLEWNEAEKSFRRALELNPTLTQVYVNYSVSTLRPLGKQEEAERLIRIGMRSDPLSLELLRELANVQIEAGRFEAALASVRQVLARDPEFLVIPQLPRALILSGRLTEAIAFLERAGLPGLDQYLAFAYVKAGRRVDAEKVALANRGYPFREAIIYAALGNRDRSFEALERMAVSEPQRLGLTLRFPELSELRDDPRFDALRKKLRLP